MNNVQEIAPDIYRLSVYDHEADLQFNHFLVDDDEPVLFHLGPNVMFERVEGMVAHVLDPSTLRWLGFSHFEADECGSLNRWLANAPGARPVCTMLAAELSVADFAIRPPLALEDGDVLDTGTHRFACRHTPHVPHGWDAGLFFDETTRTLFCSDLFFHYGDPEALTDEDIVARTRDAMESLRFTGFDHSTPASSETTRILYRLAALEPRTLAVMHGSSYYGDCAHALRELAGVFEDMWGARGHVLRYGPDSETRH